MKIPHCQLQLLSMSKYALIIVLLYVGYLPSSAAESSNDNRMALEKKLQQLQIQVEDIILQDKWVTLDPIDINNEQSEFLEEVAKADILLTHL